jgi:Skp family chaperone for outer membrane proteins
MNGLLKTGSVALILAGLLLAGQSTSEARKSVNAPNPQTHIAVFNMSVVVEIYKDSEKYKALQSETKALIGKHQDKEKKLRAEIDKATLALLPGRPEKDRQDWERYMLAHQRLLEDHIREARADVNAKIAEHKGILYKEVRDVAERYAFATGIELVMHYNDLDDRFEPAEFGSPADTLRRMQSGALTPIYAAPGIDITKEISALLKARWKPSEK